MVRHLNEFDAPIMPKQCGTCKHGAAPSANEVKGGFEEVARHPSYAMFGLRPADDR